MDDYLKTVLSRRAEQAVPDSLDLRTDIHRRLSMQQKFQPRWRLSRVALVATLVLTMATAVYAVYQAALQPDPGIAAVQTSSQIVPINQTQMIAGSELTDLQVTLDYAHADVNRITVAYSVAAEAPPDEAVELFTNPHLADDTGRPYLWLPATGQQTSTAADETGQYRVEGLMSFDASALDTQTRSLNLTLQIEVAYSTATLRANEPFGMMMAGAAAFDFSVPVNPGRIVNVSLSSAASGLALDVQQVVISPSLTRFDVCLNPARFGGDHWLTWEAVTTLTVDGQPILDRQPAAFAGLNGQPLSPELACRALTLPNALMNHTGQWTVTIHEFRNTETGERIEGEWTFNFDVTG